MGLAGLKASGGFCRRHNLAFDDDDDDDDNDDDDDDDDVPQFNAVQRRRGRRRQQASRLLPTGCFRGDGALVIDWFSQFVYPSIQLQKYQSLLAVERLPTSLR